MNVALNVTFLSVMTYLAISAIVPATPSTTQPANSYPVFVNVFAGSLMIEA